MHAFARVQDKLEMFALIVLLSAIALITFIDVGVGAAGQLRRNLGGAAGYGPSYEPGLDEEGPVISFWSQTQDLVPHLFVWATWIGISYAVRKREHFQVKVLPKGIMDGYGMTLHWVWIISALLFFVLAGRYGVEAVCRDISWGNTTSLGYSKAYVDAAVPVGAFLAVLRLAQEAMDIIVTGETEEA